jgi:excisionase family DNA binding protein
MVSTGGGPARPLPQQYLTVREVAKLLNVATSTVYKLCAEGKLAHARVSNAIRVCPDAVVALARRG